MEETPASAKYGREEVDGLKVERGKGRNLHQYEVAKCSVKAQQGIY